MIDEYRTIKSEGQGYYTDKRSKFLAFGLKCAIFVGHAVVQTTPPIRAPLLTQEGRGYLVVIFLPTLDLHILEAHGGEGLDECLGKTNICHQRNIVIDGTTADFVAVGELA